MDRRVVYVFGWKRPIRLNVKSVDDLPPRFVRKIKNVNVPDMEAIRKVLESGKKMSYAELVEKGTSIS
jgi:hypothetical protein